MAEWPLKWTGGDLIPARKIKFRCQRVKCIFTYLKQFVECDDIFKSSDVSRFVVKCLQSVCMHMCWWCNGSCGMYELEEKCM